MRKYTFKTTGILFFISILFLSSCSKNLPEQATVIEKDAVMIWVVDIPALLKKGDFEHFKDLKTYALLQQEIQAENSPFADKCNELIQDPRVSGLDIMADAFITTNQNLKPYLSLKLDDENRFVNFITGITKDAGIELQINENDNYQYTTLENEILLGWDKEKVVATINDDQALDLLEKLFTLEKENQIAAIPDFKKFYNNKNDISFWLSFNEKIMSTVPELSNKIIEDFGFDLTNSSISMGLDYAKGNITYNVRIYPNEGFRKYMESFNGKKVKFNTELLRYLPEQTCGVISGATDVETSIASMQQLKYYKDSFLKFEQQMGVSLEEILGSLNGSFVFSFSGFDEVEMTKKSLDYEFDESAAERLKDYPIGNVSELSERDKERLNNGETIMYLDTEDFEIYYISIQNILEKGGNVETAIANNENIIWYAGGQGEATPVETTEKESLPMFSLIFDTKNSNIADLLLEQSQFPLTQKDGYYLTTLGLYTGYMAFNDEVCLFTNDPKTVQAFATGGLENNLEKNKLKSNITNFESYLYLNLDLSSYPEEVRKIFSVDPKFDMLINMLESLEIEPVDDFSGNMIINLRDKKENSLRTLIVTLDETLSGMFNL
jgi:hypothetical protein